MFSSTAVVLNSMYSSGMDGCVSGYSDYLTGFCEPLSTSVTLV